MQHNAWPVDGFHTCRKGWLFSDLSCRRVGRVKRFPFDMLDPKPIIAARQATRDKACLLAGEIGNGFGILGKSFTADAIDQFEIYCLDCMFCHVPSPRFC